MTRLLEICCGDIDSVARAYKAGADRVELCSALGEGGLTPSLGMISRAVDIGIKLNVLIRPRSGDFCYSPLERDVMIDDIIAAADAGANGVVIGALLPDGEIDMHVCQPLVMEARKRRLSVTFHRAFDMCCNPISAIEKIIALGCDRLLTSGQAQSAVEGATLINKLVTDYGDRIKIMAGAGVSSDNIVELMKATNAPEFHASAKEPVASAMTWQNDGINMGRRDVDEYSRQTTSFDKVKTLAKLIHSYEN